MALGLAKLRRGQARLLRARVRVRVRVRVTVRFTVRDWVRVRVSQP